MKSLADTMLDGARQHKDIIDLYLVNGIKLRGTITTFDDTSIVLNGKQIVLRHNITTMQPGGSR